MVEGVFFLPPKFSNIYQELNVSNNDENNEKSKEHSIGYFKGVGEKCKKVKSWTPGKKNSQEIFNYGIFGYYGDNPEWIEGDRRKAGNSQGKKGSFFKENNQFLNKFIG